MFEVGLFGLGSFTPKSVNPEVQDVTIEDCHVMNAGVAVEIKAPRRNQVWTFFTFSSLRPNTKREPVLFPDYILGILVCHLTPRTC